MRTAGVALAAALSLACAGPGSRPRTGGHALDEPTPEERAALARPAAERATLPPIARAELLRQLELVDAFVPDERREALRLTQPDLEYAGVATGRDGDRLALAVREGTPGLQSCLDGVVPAPGIAWVSLLVDGDGHARDVRVEVAGGGASPMACLLERVEAWRLPPQAHSSGGLVWFQVVGAEASPAGRDAPTVSAGGRTPRAWRPDCPNERLAFALSRLGGGPPRGTFHLRFLVETDGKVSDIHFLEAVPARVARAARFAVAGCGWAAAEGVDGRPVAAWAVLAVSRAR